MDEEKKWYEKITPDMVKAYLSGSVGYMVAAVLGFLVSVHDANKINTLNYTMLIITLIMCLYMGYQEMKNQESINKYLHPKNETV